jgi:hypothetical protein
VRRVPRQQRRRGDRREHQRAGVEEERRAQRDAQHQPAERRTDDAAEQEAAAVDALRAPRWAALATRSSRLVEAIVKTAEPIPPTPRRTSSCGKLCASPASADETATTASPACSATRSPPGRRGARRQAGQQAHEREGRHHRAGAGRPDPELLASSGTAGTTMPKPSATQKATRARTNVSRGSPRRLTGSRTGGIVTAAHAPRAGGHDPDVDPLTRRTAVPTPALRTPRLPVAR